MRQASTLTESHQPLIATEEGMVLPLSVEVDGIPAAVECAGGAPGEVSGLMQINVQIPTGVRPGGYVPLTLRVGNASTKPNSVWIAVSGG